MKRLLLTAVSVAMTAGTVLAAETASAGAHSSSRSQSCPSYIADKHYFEVDTATLLRRVHLVGHLGRIHCGGADDMQYLVTNQVQRLVLNRDAVVKVLMAEAAGIEDRRIRTRRLPAWLKHDQNMQFFRVTGPNHHVSRFVELYHP